MTVALAIIGAACVGLIVGTVIVLGSRFLYDVFAGTRRKDPT